MRIVIDTNIWISGLLWKGAPWQLLKLAETGKVQLCIAYPMLLELEEVLAYRPFTTPPTKTSTDPRTTCRLRSKSIHAF